MVPLSDQSLPSAGQPPASNENPPRTAKFQPIAGILPRINKDEHSDARSQHPAVTRGRCLERLRPGGVAEFQELYHPYRSDSPTAAAAGPPLPVEWRIKGVEAAASLCIDWTFSKDLERHLAEAGFVDVSSEEFKWPLGPWMEDDERMREIGELYLQSTTMGAKGFSNVIFTAGLGWTEKRVDEYLGRAVPALTTSGSSARLWSPMKAAWGRRPRL